MSLGGWKRKLIDVKLRDKFMWLYILRKEIGVGWSYMS